MRFKERQLSSFFFFSNRLFSEPLLCKKFHLDTHTNMGLNWGSTSYKKLNIKLALMLQSSSSIATVNKQWLMIVTPMKK